MPRTAQTARKAARIDADELLRLDTLNEMEKAIERRLEATKADRRLLEASLIERIECGVSLPIGFDAQIKTTERRYPHWREIFIERHGVAQAEALLSATQPSISKRLVLKKAA